uniref:Phosphatidylinositol glycan W n=1 Tax=Toxoplasma gondii TaxID=5811 RepID=Q68V05_TOXGO|nr:phosphatidylinositol glycan W [Toxoplasma gondii]
MKEAEDRRRTGENEQAEKEGKSEEEKEEKDEAEGLLQLCLYQQLVSLLGLLARRTGARLEGQLPGLSEAQERIEEQGALNALKSPLTLSCIGEGEPETSSSSPSASPSAASVAPWWLPWSLSAGPAWWVSCPADTARRLGTPKAPRQLPGFGRRSRRTPQKAAEVPDAPSEAEEEAEAEEKEGRFRDGIAAAVPLQARWEHRLPESARQALAVFALQGETENNQAEEEERRRKRTWTCSNSGERSELYDALQEVAFSNYEFPPFLEVFLCVTLINLSVWMFNAFSRCVASFSAWRSQRFSRFGPPSGNSTSEASDLSETPSASAVAASSSSYARTPVTEYGKHWNFYMSLMVLFIAAELLLPGSSSRPFLYVPMGVALASVYQLLLWVAAAETWVLTADRDSFFALYMIGVGVGSLFFSAASLSSRRPVSEEGEKGTAAMKSQTVSRPPSRFALIAINLPWVLLVAALNLYGLAGVLLSEALVGRGPAGASYLVSGLSQNQIFIFLIANVLCGLTGLSMNRLLVPPALALSLLLLYALSWAFVAFGLGYLEKRIPLNL